MRSTRRSKHRSSLLHFIISIVFFIATISVIFIIVYKNLGSDEPAKPVRTHATVDMSESNYPGIKIVTETANDPFSPFAVQYPQSKFTRFNEQVKTYIESAKDDYFNALGKKIGELNISFDTFYHSSGYYSFIFYKHSYIAKNNEATSLDSFHLQINNGESFDLKTLLNSNESHLQKFASAVRKKLTSDERLAGRLFESQMERATEPLWENFANFALTESSVNVYFEQQQIAARSLGTIVVELPFSTMEPLLANEWKHLIAKNDGPVHSNDKNKPTVINDDSKIEEGTKQENDSSANHDEATVTKRVALTFDDGPDPRTTPKILETLKKYEAKATFFLLGSRVEYYPELAKRIYNEGHELGNHTWTHSDLTRAKPDRITQELSKTSKIIEEVTGVKTAVFRPPYGAMNNYVRSHVDLPTILWTVDSLDWKHRDPKKLLHIIKSYTKDGSIILMHDIHQATADGLDAVLAFLQGEGYTFVTVSELGVTH